MGCKVLALGPRVALRSPEEETAGGSRRPASRCTLRGRRALAQGRRRADLPHAPAPARLSTSSTASAAVRRGTPSTSHPGSSTTIDGRAARETDLRERPPAAADGDDRVARGDEARSARAHPGHNHVVDPLVASARDSPAGSRWSFRPPTSRHARPPPSPRRARPRQRRAALREQPADLLGPRLVLCAPADHRDLGHGVLRRSVVAPRPGARTARRRRSRCRGGSAPARLTRHRALQAVDGVRERQRGRSTEGRPSGRAATSSPQRSTCGDDRGHELDGLELGRRERARNSPSDIPSSAFSTARRHGPRPSPRRRGRAVRTRHDDDQRLDGRHERERDRVPEQQVELRERHRHQPLERPRRPLAQHRDRRDDEHRRSGKIPTSGPPIAVERLRLPSKTYLKSVSSTRGTTNRSASVRGSAEAGAARGPRSRA